MVVQRGRGWLDDPPEERRCQRVRRDGTRCKAWTCRGRRWCKTHGGKRRLKAFNRKMARDLFYGSDRECRFNELLARLSDGKADERENLSAEVDVARVIAEKAVSLFRAGSAADAKPETLMMAMKLAQDALTHVSDLVVKLTKVKAVSRDTIDVRQAADLIDQVGEVLRRRLADRDPELLRELLEGINTIKLDAASPVQIVFG